MEIRVLDNGYAVAAQISPEQLPAIAAAGYRTIICNRPDSEVMPAVQSSEIRRAAEAAGLAFVDNPIAQNDLTEQQVRRQYEAVSSSPGPTLAYCASGTRSTVVWMFGAIRDRKADELIGAAERAGYPLRALRPQLEYLQHR